jgi:uncharacterized protein YeaO (DUF488 family)
MIRIKRVYSEATPRDGIRLLVDRVWPRGISKKRARIVAWRKDLAPTASLRKWFGHQLVRWAEFRRRYQTELRRPRLLEKLRDLAQLSCNKTITLVYSAADEEHNQAIVLKNLIEKCLRGPSKRNARDKK